MSNATALTKSQLKSAAFWTFHHQNRADGAGDLITFERLYAKENGDTLILLATYTDTLLNRQRPAVCSITRRGKVYGDWDTDFRSGLRA